MDLSLLKAYALQFVGIQYHFGGDDPISGFDCSGLVSELLRAAGLVPFNFRTNAQGIHDLFEKNGSVNAWGLGALAFYGPSIDKIDHVAFCLDDRMMIEAGGGRADTLTPEIASQENAFVKIRPIKYRKDFLLVIKPFYPGTLPS